MKPWDISTAADLAPRSNEIRTFCIEPGGTALWFGTAGRGAIRYDWKSTGLTIYTTTDGLADNDVRAIYAEPGGAGIWFGTRRGGVSRYDLKSEVFSTVNVADVLATAQDLPATDVNLLAPVPGTGSRPIWVGTAAGAAQVRAKDGKLEIERIATYDEDGLSTGPVNALAALPDGSVFLGYNAIDFKLILNPELPAQREGAHVRRFTAKGPAGPPIFLGEPEGEEIRALVVSTESQEEGGLYPDSRETITQRTVLWAATSMGLFKVVDAGKSGATFEAVNGEHGLSLPLHKIKRRDDGTIWVITELDNDGPKVIGYRPGAENTVALTPAHGIPKGYRIDDIDFTEDGELVVMVGSSLIKGHVTVPGRLPWHPMRVMILVLTFSVVGYWAGVFLHPQVVRVRAHPESLGELPLSQLPTALQRLRWAWALAQVCERVNLSDARLQAIQALAVGTPDAHRLRILAAHLGMEGADAAPFDELDRGLWVLVAELPDPEPLRGLPTPIVGFDRGSARGVDPAALRDKIAGALRQYAHRSELPFLVFCREGKAACEELIPEGRVALILGEDELRQLLFAPSPRQLFAGLLLTRDLLALSPYRPEGVVTTPAMFYGRSRLLRELMTAEPLHFLLVGPRRVGKSSVLRQLREDLAVHRPDLDLVHLDLLGLSEPGRVLRKLAGKLELPSPADAETTDEHAEVLAALLTERFAGSPGVLLIDEADGLVEVDAGRGYPLLSTLRTLQAEGVGSCVLAGYWHLYRRTLDHGSPLYNFAPVRRLGPLEREAGRDLATEPMGRLGLRWADRSLPVRLVERTGGYPNLIQLVCHQLLVVLRHGRTLTLTAEHLERAERSSQVRDYLVWSFGMNALPAAQVMVDGLLEREAFTVAEAHACLEQAVGREVPIGVLDQLLIQLVLYGFVTRSEAGYGWTMPLLREALLTAEDRAHRLGRLVRELPADPAAWAVWEGARERFRRR